MSTHKKAPSATTLEASDNEINFEEEIVMSNSTVKTVRPQESASIDVLAGSIATMDCLAQEGFSAIASIARLALAGLRQPDRLAHMQDIGNALMTIASKAEDIQNCINVQAEMTGNHWRAEPILNHHH